MPLDAYAADLLAVACTHGAAFQLPDTMYVHLCTTAPAKTVPGTDSGLGAVLTTMSADWSSDGAGLLASLVVLDFGDAAVDAAGVHWAELWDSADNLGQRWLYGTLTGTYNVVAGQPVRFPIGSLRIPAA